MLIVLAIIVAGLLGYYQFYKNTHLNQYVNYIPGEIIIYVSSGKITLERATQVASYINGKVVKCADDGFYCLLQVPTSEKIENFTIKIEQNPNFKDISALPNLKTPYDDCSKGPC